MIFLKSKVILCLIIILILFGQLFAQSEDLKFTHLDVNNGLSQNQVFCLYSDYKGLLWFGSQEGLNMYDGYTFRIFRHLPGNINSLPDYAVNTICETYTGIFWIGGRGGIDRYDFKKNKFYNYKLHPENPASISINGVTSLYIEDNILWVGTTSGGKIKRIKNKSGTQNTLSNDFIHTIRISGYGNVWIGTGAGFPGNFLVPKTIDSDVTLPRGEALLTNLSQQRISSSGRTLAAGFTVPKKKGILKRS